MAALTESTSRLLELPPELRNRIYRLVACERHRIPVSAQGYDVSPLLSVCKQIRNEARGIFYYENAFGFEVQDFDIRLCYKFEKHMSKIKIRSKRVRRRYTVYVDDTSKSLWPNLLHWLKLIHGRKVWDTVATPAKHLAGGSTREALEVSAFFEVASSLDDMPWKRVEQLLLGMRPLLVFHRAQWAEDGRGKGDQGKERGAEEDQAGYGYGAPDTIDASQWVELLWQ